MKILVTGSTGFIGSHLIEQLVKEGHEVRALVRDEERNSNAKVEAMNLLEKLKVEIVWGDLLDAKSLIGAVKGVEGIFHLAAIARPMAIQNRQYFEVNENGTRNLFEAAKIEKVKKIVLMSSVSAVGQSKDGNAVNEKTKCHPVDIYGWSKLAQEKVAEGYVEKGDLNITILRPPMVFGPRDKEMLRLFKSVNNRFFPLDAKEKCMEFLYVKNLVEACLLAFRKGKNGEKYHITNGEHYSINGIIHSIELAQKRKIFPISFPEWVFLLGGSLIEFAGKVFNFHPPFKHDTVDWMTKKLWYVDDSKIKKELGYAPKITLNQGVKETFDYYQRIGEVKRY